MNGNYERVSRAKRCPICNKPDWCLIAKDGSAVICPRVPEGGRFIGEAGYLHKMTDAEPATFRAGVNVYIAPQPGFDATKKIAAMQNVVDADDVGLADYSAQLGVSVESQKLLGIGYSRLENAFGYPMKDHAERTIGIRLRNIEGRKWAVNGSRSGLFVGPKRKGPLFIGEGPTDTAALLDLGCWAIGRPSCRGGTVELLKYVQKHRPWSMVIVSDCDGPGVVGAEDLADSVWRFVDSVRVIEPLVGKDIRHWRIQGCTPDQLKQVVNNSAPWARRQVA